MYLLALLTVSNDQWVREKKGEFSERKKSQELVMQMNQSWLFSQYNFTNLTIRYSVKTGCLNKFKFEDEFVFFLFYKHLLRHFDKSSRVNMFHDYRKTILFMRGGGGKIGHRKASKYKWYLRGDDFQEILHTF